MNLVPGAGGCCCRARAGAGPRTAREATWTGLGALARSGALAPILISGDAAPPGRAPRGGLLSDQGTRPPQRAGRGRAARDAKVLPKLYRLKFVES